MRDDKKLRAVRVIGFTGHRHLGRPLEVGEMIRVELERLRHELHGEIAGYSSIAIGADTLFVEACLSLNLRWSATLPFPPDDFRDDFTEAEWAHATKLLDRAIEVEISGSPEDRNAAYLNCGLRTVDGADLLLAVWDGNPARGTGGTAEVVDYARRQRKPLILIHPDQLRIEREV